MHRWLSLLAAAVLVGPAPAGAAGDPALCDEADARYAKLMGDAPVAPGVVIVKMYKFNFCPSRVEIAPGTTVRWINLERTSHNAWLKDSGQTEPERLFQGESWEFTFSQPGEYPYLCGPHWQQEGMTGTVVVK